MMTPFWKLAQRYPPCLVRMLARHRRGRLKTDDEIAAASGLPPEMVRLISHSVEWDHIAVGLMKQFLQGCAIDFDNRRQMGRLAEYLAREPRLVYLRKDLEWETRWKPIIKRWRKVNDGQRQPA